MAGTYRRGEQGDRLLRQPLADLQSLGRCQRHVAGAKLLYLFAVDLSPLLLVADRQERSLRCGLHALILVAAKLQQVGAGGGAHLVRANSLTEKRLHRLPEERSAWDRLPTLRHYWTVPTG
jgi:hypothetical protein